MDYKFLENINSPEDIKKIESADIPELCSELRSFLIEKVEKSGGHLASNLGVTELTVALHRVFNSPSDKIIFDVGHQAYVHKIITGRKDDFSSLREPGGLSGFTTRRESEHDPFGAGHSSTSISAALGFAESNFLAKNDDYAVCVIGDGAYTGGMVHEALNNCRRDLKLVIVINENRMSISKNKGAFASYLAKIRISKGYRKWKEGTSSFLHHIPLIGKPLHKLFSLIKNTIKNMIYPASYFEDLGLYYIGPVNGNDYNAIEKALKEAKNTGKCVVVHAFTKKGKGYEPAEKAPDGFHSISGTDSNEVTLHQVFADKLIEIAKEREDVVAITAAMGIGTGLDTFGKKYPDRYFDVGIAEAHALTFSAGLAAANLKPYVAIYSTFLQRGYDNIVHDIALQNLPVKMIIDRAGLAVRDGATHHGIFDVAFLSQIPNVSLLAPVTYGSLRCALSETVECNSPIALRYSNSAELSEIRERFYSDGDYSSFGVVADFEMGCAPENVFVTYGNITANVIEAAKLLSDGGIASGIILVERLKPYNDTVEKISRFIKGAKKVLFVEEGIKNGGFSMISLELLREKYDFTRNMDFAIRAIDDTFAIPEEKCDIYDYLGFSPEKLAEEIKNI
ncbi:MAG: 1-deoxy-D-xylulose-5-phosphate synthase [Ruminococcaceae bacterium]|nr:1-deoxy-D-xylulose-5-phosphate synthase [Oscillospiraceae bacterium]